MFYIYKKKRITFQSKNSNIAGDIIAKEIGDSWILSRASSLISRLADIIIIISTKNDTIPLSQFATVC